MPNQLPLAKAPHTKTTGKEYLLVALFWLFFQVIWYLFLGVHFDLEAGKYIDEAAYFLQHYHFSASRYLFYSTTIFVIAFSTWAKLGLYGALLIIMFINLLSYLYFYKALKRLFPLSLAPYLVILLLLGFWPYQSWTLFLFTEAFFYSMVLCLFSHLIRYRELTVRFCLLTLFWLVLVVLSRPLGILFVPPALLFLFLQLTQKQKIYFSVAVVLALVALNYIVEVVFTTTSDWNMGRALTEDSIICDIPRRTSAAGLDLTQSSNQLYQLFYYVVHNFVHFAGLALTRLRYFFTMVRDYFSTFHNLYLVICLAFFYGSCLVGIKRITRFFPRALLLFIVSAIFLFAATVALQCDDYHNRFALTLMPFYATLAVWAWLPLIRRISFLK